MSFFDREEEIPQSITPEPKDTFLTTCLACHNRTPVPVSNPPFGTPLRCIYCQTPLIRPSMLDEYSPLKTSAKLLEQVYGYSGRYLEHPRCPRCNTINYSIVFPERGQYIGWYSVREPEKPEAYRFTVSCVQCGKDFHIEWDENPIKAEPAHKETTSESNWFNMGLNNFGLGRFAEAAECFDKAIQSDQQYADAWNNKGNCLQMMGRDAEAISCYKKALEINHTDANSWYNKARAEEKLGQLNYAMNSYYKFLECAPTTMSEDKRDAAEKFKQLSDQLGPASNLSLKGYEIPDFSRANELLKTTMSSGARNHSELLRGLRVENPPHKLADVESDEEYARSIARRLYSETKAPSVNQESKPSNLEKKKKWWQRKE